MCLLTYLLTLLKLQLLQHSLLYQSLIYTKIPVHAICIITVHTWEKKVRLESLGACTTLVQLCNTQHAKAFCHFVRSGRQFGEINKQISETKVESHFQKGYATRIWKWGEFKKWRSGSGKLDSPLWGAGRISEGEVWVCWDFKVSYLSKSLKCLENYYVSLSIFLSIYKFYVEYSTCHCPLIYRTWNRHKQDIGWHFSFFFSLFLSICPFVCPSFHFFVFDLFILFVCFCHFYFFS